MRKNCCASCINQAEERRQVVGDDVEPMKICCCPCVFDGSEDKSKMQYDQFTNLDTNENSFETKWKIDYNDVAIEVY